MCWYGRCYRIRLWGADKLYLLLRADVHKGTANNLTLVAAAIDIADGAYRIRNVDRFLTVCICFSCPPTFYHVDVYLRVAGHIGMIASAIDVADAGRGLDVDRYLRVWICMTKTRIGSIVAAAIEVFDDDGSTIFRLLNVDGYLTIDETAGVVAAKHIREVSASNSHRDVAKNPGIVRAGIDVLYVRRRNIGIVTDYSNGSGTAAAIRDNDIDVFFYISILSSAKHVGHLQRTAISACTRLVKPYRTDNTSLIAATECTVEIASLERDIADADHSTRAFHPFVFRVGPDGLAAVTAAKDGFYLIGAPDGDVALGHCCCIAAAKDELDTRFSTTMNVHMCRFPFARLVGRQIAAAIDILDFIGSVFMLLAFVWCGSPYRYLYTAFGRAFLVVGSEHTSTRINRSTCFASQFITV